MECGYQFTSKLEGMFNDMRLSSDVTADFQAFVSDSHSAGSVPNLAMSLLTSTFWPVSASFEGYSGIEYPKEISSIIKLFENFYQKRHSGRKLTWLPLMGPADIKVQFDSSKKEINVSTFGMIILLCVFSKQDSASFEDIRAKTGIDAHDLTRTLQSLSFGKYKILLKTPVEKDISQTDIFTFNSSFTSPLMKIKILNISGSTNAAGAEHDQERTKTMEKVDEDRKHQIEAAIVRIMKARKTLNHSNLIVEVIEQLKSRFSPSPIMVKKRIEGLIEREYLDRDPNDFKTYVYLA